jgi:hypothetical protein
MVLAPSGRGCRSWPRCRWRPERIQEVGGGTFRTGRVDLPERAYHVQRRDRAHGAGAVMSFAPGAGAG